MAPKESVPIEEAYTARVRAYWDSTTALYLEHVGSTFQAARWPGGSDPDQEGALNRYLATAAGIRPGQRVLDAGCGVCGPSIDIALACEDVRIDAVTLSPVQAEIARQRVGDAGLAQRISVHVGDFHVLPFPAGAFDVALFLESVCYSYDPVALFVEVRRVLQPGATVYIKDIFRLDRPLSAQEEEQLTKMSQIYTSQLIDLQATVNALAEAGFAEITTRSLADDLSFGQAVRSFFTVYSGLPLLNEFGRRHYQRLGDLPVFVAEISARA